jgi:hypothetical protein
MASMAIGDTRLLNLLARELLIYAIAIPFGGFGKGEFRRGSL